MIRAGASVGGAEFSMKRATPDRLVTALIRGRVPDNRQASQGSSPGGSSTTTIFRCPGSTIAIEGEAPVGQGTVTAAFERQVVPGDYRERPSCPGFVTSRRGGARRTEARSSSTSSSSRRSRRPSWCRRRATKVLLEDSPTTISVIDRDAIETSAGAAGRRPACDGAGHECVQIVGARRQRGDQPPSDRSSPAASSRWWTDDRSISTSST